MKLATLFEIPLSFLKRLVSFFSAHNETDLFLQSRNARLIVQDADERSFHAFRLRSQSDVAAFGRTLKIHFKYFEDQTARVRVIDKATNRVLIDVSAPVSQEADTMYLNFADVHLRIEIDAAQPSDTQSS